MKAKRVRIHTFSQKTKQNLWPSPTDPPLSKNFVQSWNDGAESSPTRSESSISPLSHRWIRQSAAFVFRQDEIDPPDSSDEDGKTKEDKNVVWETITANGHGPSIVYPKSQDMVHPLEPELVDQEPQIYSLFPVSPDKPREFKCCFPGCKAGPFEAQYLL